MANSVAQGAPITNHQGNADQALKEVSPSPVKMATMKITEVFVKHRMCSKMGTLHTLGGNTS